MEQVTHILVDQSTYSIIVCGNRGSQRILRFHHVTFYNVLDYCATKLRREHILYIG